MGAGEYKLTLIVDSRGFVTGMQAADGQFVSFADHVKSQSSSLRGQIKEHWLAITAAVTAGIVAIDKAMKYIDMGARAQQSEETFEKIAASFGVNAGAMMAKMKELSQGMVDDSDLAQKSLQGFAMGLDDKKILGLLDASRNAAKVWGQDVGTTFDSLITAVGGGVRAMGPLVRMGLITKDEFQLLNKAVLAGVDNIDAYSIVMAHAAIQNARFSNEEMDAFEKMQKFNAETTDLKENIGKSLVKALEYGMGGMQLLASGVLRVVAAYKEWLAVKGQLGAINPLNTTKWQQGWAQYAKQMEIDAQAATAAADELAAKAAEKFSPTARPDDSAARKAKADEAQKYLDDVMAQVKAVDSAASGGRDAFDALSDGVQGFAKSLVSMNPNIDDTEKKLRDLSANAGQLVSKIMDDPKITDAQRQVLYNQVLDVVNKGSEYIQGEGKQKMAAAYAELMAEIGSQNSSQYEKDLADLDKWIVDKLEKYKGDGEATNKIIEFYAAKQNEIRKTAQKEFSDAFDDFMLSDVEKQKKAINDKLAALGESSLKELQAMPEKYAEISAKMSAAIDEADWQKRVVEGNERIKYSLEETSKGFEGFVNDLLGGANNLLSVFGLQLPSALQKFLSSMQGIDKLGGNGIFGQVGMGARGVGMLGMGDSSQMIANLASWGVIKPETAYNWMQPGGFGGTLGAIGGAMGGAGMIYGGSQMGGLGGAAMAGLGAYSLGSMAISGALGSGVATALGTTLGPLFNLLPGIGAALAVVTVLLGQMKGPGGERIPDMSLWYHGDNAWTQGKNYNPATGVYEGQGWQSSATPGGQYEVAWQGGADLSVSAKQITDAFKQTADDVVSALSGMGYNAALPGNKPGQDYGWSFDFESIQGKTQEEISQILTGAFSDFAQYVAGEDIAGRIKQFQDGGESFLDTLARIYSAFKKFPGLFASFDAYMEAFNNSYDVAAQFENQLRQSRADIDAEREALAKMIDPSKAEAAGEKLLQQTVQYYQSQIDNVRQLQSGAEQLRQTIQKMKDDIVRTREAMGNWLLGIQTKIDSLTGGTGASSFISQFSGQLRQAILDASNPDLKLELLGTAQQWVDSWYQQQLQQIQSQARSWTVTIPGNRSVIEPQIEALNKQLDVIKGWEELLGRIDDTIRNLSVTAANPADILERMGIARSEIDRVFALYQGATGADRLNYAQQLEQLIPQYLSMAKESGGPQRGGLPYEAIYDDMMKMLGVVKDDAAQYQGQQEAVQQQIVTLQGQIRDAVTVTMDNSAEINAKIAALNAQAAAQYEWIKGQGQQAYLDKIQAQTDAVAAQETQLAEVEKHLTDIVGELGVDGYIADIQRQAVSELGAIKAILQGIYDQTFAGAAIPHFANGGFVTRPTLAWVGDGGEPEHIIPESKMGGGGTVYHIGGIDARGSSDPVAVEEAVYRGVEKAIRSAVRFDDAVRKEIKRIR